MNKSLVKITVLVLMLGLFIGCKKDSRPNYQFMPDMYEPVGYEAYGEYDVFPNEQEAMLTVEGTIPRGSTLFEYENSNDGYEDAKANLKNPLDSTDLGQIETKAIYDIYCGICHGTKGDGQGTLVKKEKILGVPAYNDAGRNITAGSIYHTIYYGKNTMGSYANQLSEKERWQVVDYVLKLKSELGGAEEETDTTATDNQSLTPADAEVSAAESE